METKYTITVGDKKYGCFRFATSATVAALTMGMGSEDGDGFDVDTISSIDDVINISGVWSYREGTRG